MNTVGDVTGIVLCGGEGSRLGGADKPLEAVGKVPLVGRVCNRLAPQVRRIVIACNRNADVYRPWAAEVVKDAVPGQGPLSGMLAALARVTTPLAFVCPGDAPGMAASLVARLAAALRPDVIACIPHDGERLQPLFIVLRTSARANIEDYFAAGGRSVRGWLQTIDYRVVDMADERDSFFNVNTPADLARLRNEVAHSR